MKPALHRTEGGGEALLLIPKLEKFPFNSNQALMRKSYRRFGAIQYMHHASLPGSCGFVRLDFRTVCAWGP